MDISEHNLKYYGTRIKKKTIEHTTETGHLKLYSDLTSPDSAESLAEQDKLCLRSIIINYLYAISILFTPLLSNTYRTISIVPKAHVLYFPLPCNHDLHSAITLTL